MPFDALYSRKFGNFITDLNHLRSFRGVKPLKQRRIKALIARLAADVTTVSCGQEPYTPSGPKAYKVLVRMKQS
jgi:hypothetical protein